MATKKMLHDAIRASYMEKIRTYLNEQGEELLTTNSNEITIPCVDAEGNEEFLVITFKIPSGSRDGDVYDGYEEAQAYADKCKEKAEKAKEAEQKKKAKIEKDKAMREAKAKAKAEREAGG